MPDSCENPGGKLLRALVRELFFRELVDSAGRAIDRLSGLHRLNRVHAQSDDLDDNNDVSRVTRYQPLGIVGRSDIDFIDPSESENTYLANSLRATLSLVATT